jgi:hypothetical protein
MEYIRLTLGLLLPWAAGYFWLLAIESLFRTPEKPNRLRQLGYGLFLGYAALQGIVLASAHILNRVEFWPVLAVIALITATGGLLSMASGSTHYTTRTAAQMPAGTQSVQQYQLSPAARLLVAILLGLAVLHLALAAIEIFIRPVYPWDAWLAWMYRAKAWFFSGNVYQLASPSDWLAGTTSATYTIDAYDYPTFASIIPFWAALSLGQWSETLVNTPVLCCGIALGLGVYGTCREYGMPAPLSMAAAYFLLSLPLVGTHLSLAGYADIWLAGFTGLGFAALINGLTSKSTFQLLLGLGMIALGVGVKNEGLVWLYLALALVLLSSVRLNIVLAALAAITLLGIAAWWSDLTYIELPLAGGAGLLDGRVHIPFVGSHKLQTYSILQPYLNSFFVHGSWHLLWTLLLLAIGALFYLRKSSASRVIAIFLGLFLASQFFIFGYTEQGRWAASYTAINRLAMHFAPALVICLFICLYNLLVQATTSGANPPRAGLFRYSLPGLLAALLVVVGTAVYLQPEKVSSTASRQFLAADLRLMMGRGNISDNTAHVTAYKKGLAIVSSGPISIKASEFPLLSYNLESSHPEPPSFFWRTASNPLDVEIIHIESDTAGSLRLADYSSWKGDITEIGVTFHGDQGHPALIRQLSVQPETLGTNIAALWSGWTAFEPWSHSSINWRAGGRTGLPMPAPVILGLWSLSCLFIYLLASRLLPARKSTIVAFSLCALLAWGLLDALWMTNRLEQTRLSLDSKEMRGAKACIDIIYDCKLADLAAKVRGQVAAGQEEKILIAYPDPGDRFQALRIKYRLLPLPALVYKGPVSALPRGSENYILLLNDTAVKPGKERVKKRQQKFKPRKKRSIVMLWQSPDGALYKIQSRVK